MCPLKPFQWQYSVSITKDSHLFPITCCCKIKINKMCFVLPRMWLLESLLPFLTLTKLDSLHLFLVIEKNFAKLRLQKKEVFFWIECGSIQKTLITSRILFLTVSGKKRSLFWDKNTEWNEQGKKKWKLKRFWCV